MATGKFLVFGESYVHGLNDAIPILGSLPPGWRRIERRRNPNDPYIFDRFKNNVTGDVVKSDPRMLPDILRARDVKLDSFLLV
jgi:hypothetical protein